MRLIKFGSFAVVLLVAVYALSRSFLTEGESYTVQKSIAYPVDQVYPQFSNLQSFARWNTYFSENKNFSFTYFSPYVGQGSSMKYHDRKDNDVFGEMFIRYANLNRTLRYQLYHGNNEKPYLIDLKFRPSTDATEVIWHIKTPEQPWWKSSVNFFSDKDIDANVDKSMQKLFSILGNKVQKDMQRENMKFDSLMVEENEGQLLLGVNVSAKNTRDFLFRNIVLNHNKTLNYIKTDLAKRDDEYGEPILITDADNFKDKEVSYFYGIPVAARVGLSDNSFTFRTVNASRNYVVYYRGSYAGRVKAIQQILQKAKRDTLRTGDLQQTFLEEPSVENNTVLKLSVPVYK